MIDRREDQELVDRLRALGTGCRCQMHFDARVVLIDVFVEMGFDDAVVIDAESLTEGILRDLESAIDVSSQGRGKIEPDGQGEPVRLESCKEGSPVSGLRQLQPHELSYLGLIGTTSRRDQSSAIHSGILMVHAGGHREGQGYRMTLGRWVRSMMEDAGMRELGAVLGAIRGTGTFLSGSGRRWCERPVERKEAGSGAET